MQSHHFAHVSVPSRPGIGQAPGPTVVWYLWGKKPLSTHAPVLKKQLFALAPMDRPSPKVLSLSVLQKQQFVQVSMVPKHLFAKVSMPSR